MKPDDIAPVLPGGRTSAAEATSVLASAQGVAGVGQASRVAAALGATSAGAACACSRPARRLDRWLVEADVRWMVEAFGE